MNLQKTFLQMQIGNVLSRKQELEWLVQQGVQAESVANFGCHIGGETLALVWALGASEAVGLDKDEQAVLQARDTLKSILSVGCIDHRLSSRPPAMDRLAHKEAKRCSRLANVRCAAAK